MSQVVTGLPARLRGRGPSPDEGPRRRKGGLNRGERVAGWLFAAPALAGLAVFLFLPVGIALWFSFRDWNGVGPPGSSSFVGLDNYQDLLSRPGLARTDFALSLRNNFYYVLGVVPAQTALALFLAVVLNQRRLHGRGFFRSAFFFPSITSSIAISLIFIFLFQPRGVVNEAVGAGGFNWLENADGLGHQLLGLVGVDQPPGWLADHSTMGLSWWEWLSGPSVTMTTIMILATWTASGSLMLIFLAGLQTIPVEIEEAAVVDGANGWQRFWRITLPMLRPTMFFVLTLGVISTWQVFDQIVAITAGGPQKTTLTPAYLVYREGFKNFSMGRATAVAFILLIIIMVFTVLQRAVVNRAEDS